MKKRRLNETETAKPENLPDQNCYTTRRSLLRLILLGVIGIGTHSLSTLFKDDHKNTPFQKTPGLEFNFLWGHSPEVIEKIGKTDSEQYLIINKNKELTDVVSAPFDVDKLLKKDLPEFQEQVRQTYGAHCTEILKNRKIRMITRAVPDDVYGKEYSAYSRFAMNFLDEHEEFNDLSVPDIEWLIPGSPRQASNKIPAYIALCYLSEAEIGMSCKLADGSIVKTMARVSQPSEGSMGNYFSYLYDGNSKGTLKRVDNQVIVLGTNNSPVGLLQAPFSEALPIMLYSGLEKYIEKEGKDTPDYQAFIDSWKKFMSLVEAVSESISLYLVDEILKEEEMKGAKNFVTIEDVVQHKFKLNRIDPVYSLVPAACEYLQRTGIENTIKKFLETPSTYLKEITEIKKSLRPDLSP